MKKIVIAAVLMTFAFEANANSQETKKTVQQHLQTQTQQAEREKCDRRNPVTGPWCDVVDRNVRKASVHTRFTVDRKIQRKIDKLLRKIDRKL